MAEIGATLREARMRQRIDITDMEVRTKIRAKYLRALENEEWDLLPGPTYVRSFLRTYAEALDLDAKMIVEEYKLRHEPMETGELHPIRRPSSRERERRRTAAGPAARGGRGGRGFPRAALIGLVLAAILAALYVVGRGNDDEPDPVATMPAMTTPADEAARTSRASATRKSTPAASGRGPVACSSCDPAAVSVSLVDARRDVLIGNEILQPGRRTADVPLPALPGWSWQQRGVRSCGEREVPGTCRRPVSRSPYEITRRGRRDHPGGPAAHVRRMSARAGVGRHGHGGAHRARSSTATARGCPSACASSASSTPTRSSSATARGPDGRLRFFADAGMDVVCTSGGLGPTEDDLTARIVADFTGRAFVLDEALEGRIAKILERLTKRWPDIDQEAIRAGNRKQAMVPEGGRVLEPVGTAPGFVVRSPSGPGPTVVVLPGPPRELQPMWEDAIGPGGVPGAVAGRTEYRQEMLRMFGIPESEIAETCGSPAARASTSTRWRSRPACAAARSSSSPATSPRPPRRTRRSPPWSATGTADTLFSDDGSSVDDQVARLLQESSRTIAVAESCTGGLLAGRLTDLAGSSAYVLGGLVVYANAAKVALAGVDEALIDRVGAVSVEVAQALAQGAAERLGADVGVGITGIAGPGGGSEDKPVGTVCFAAWSSEGSLTRRLHLPGSRADVRDRSTTVAMHLVRRLLLGERD
jgi:nicotinamide-nucleotide amidase